MIACPSAQSPEVLACPDKKRSNENKERAELAYTGLVSWFHVTFLKGLHWP